MSLLTAPQPCPQTALKRAQQGVEREKKHFTSVCKPFLVPWVILSAAPRDREVTDARAEVTSNKCGIFELSHLGLAHFQLRFQSRSGNLSQLCIV